MLQNGYRALYDFSDTFPFMTRIRICASSEHEPRFVVRPSTPQVLSDGTLRTRPLSKPTFVLRPPLKPPAFTDIFLRMIFKA